MPKDSADAKRKIEEDTNSALTNVITAAIKLKIPINRLIMNTVPRIVSKLLDFFFMPDSFFSADYILYCNGR
jgi:hypothetical protein